MLSRPDQAKNTVNEEAGSSHQNEDDDDDEVILRKEKEAEYKRDSRRCFWPEGEKSVYNLLSSLVIVMMHA